MSIYEIIKTTVQKIEWPAIKLEQLTTFTIQELALIALVLAILISGIGVIKFLAWVTLGVVVATLAYRFIKEKILK